MGIYLKKVFKVFGVTFYTAGEGEIYIKTQNSIPRKLFRKKG